MRFDYQVTRLPNGLVVATAPLPHVESVSLGVWARAGGRYEAAADQGISHFLEHLLFKGTPTRSARRIAAAIEGCGGYCDAFTQEESTCYYARVPAEHAPQVFDILVDMYQHARLADADVRSERAVILEEIRMYRDQPQQRVQEMLEEMLWVNHPLGRNVAGSERSIAGLTPARLRRFRDEVYTPVNTLLAVAGLVEHRDFVQRAERAFRSRPRGRRLRRHPVTAATRQARLRVATDDTEQVQLAMGFRTFGRRDPRRFALRLLSILLGESASSRLFQEIRERRGWAYHIHSEMRLYADTGVLDLEAGLERDRALDALRRIVAELRRLRESGVSRRELKVAKDYAIGQARIGLEGTSSRMSWLGENLMNHGRVVSPEEIIQGLAAVDEEQIRHVAREAIDPGRLSLALIHPDDAAAIEPRVSALLARLG